MCHARPRGTHRTPVPTKKSRRDTGEATCARVRKLHMLHDCELVARMQVPLGGPELHRLGIGSIRLRSCEASAGRLETFGHDDPVIRRPSPAMAGADRRSTCPPQFIHS
jgi:hypothetical protein